MYLGLYLLFIPIDVLFYTTTESLKIWVHDNWSRNFFCLHRKFWWHKAVWWRARPSCTFVLCIPCWEWPVSDGRPHDWSLLFAWRSCTDMPKPCDCSHPVWGHSWNRHHRNQWLSRHCSAGEDYTGVYSANCTIFLNSSILGLRVFILCLQAWREFWTLSWWKGEPWHLVSCMGPSFDDRKQPKMALWKASMSCSI